MTILELRIGGVILGIGADAFANLGGVLRRRRLQSLASSRFVPLFVVVVPLAFATLPSNVGMHDVYLQNANIFSARSIFLEIREFHDEFLQQQFCTVGWEWEERVFMASSPAEPFFRMRIEPEILRSA